LIFWLSRWSDRLLFQFLLFRAGAKLCFFDFPAFALERQAIFSIFTVSRRSETLVLEIFAA